MSLYSASSHLTGLTGQYSPQLLVRPTCCFSQRWRTDRPFVVWKNEHPSLEVSFEASEPFSRLRNSCFLVVFSYLLVLLVRSSPHKPRFRTKASTSLSPPENTILFMPFLDYVLTWLGENWCCGLLLESRGLINKQGWFNTFKRDKTRTRVLWMAYIFPLDVLSIFSIIVAGWIILSRQLNRFSSD